MLAVGESVKRAALYVVEHGSRNERPLGDSSTKLAISRMGSTISC